MPLPPSTPDLASLDLFRSIVELGSVSRAAGAHHITQPSASSRIRHLESQLGLVVLERSRTGSRPTAEGQLVANLVDNVLRAAEQLAAGVESIKAEQTGLLRIAASYTVAEYLLPLWLEAFLSERSGDSVTLDVTNSSAVINKLERGAVDLGFVEGPTVPPAVSAQTVGHDSLAVVVSARHPWVRARTIDLATFTSTPLVMREPGSGTREALEQALLRLGSEHPITGLELGSISAVRIAVIHGSYPTAISRLAVAADLAAGTLVEIEVQGLRVERELRAVWPRDTPLARLARQLLQQLPHTA